MKVYVSHLTGNSNVRATVSGLLEADLLGEFYTSIASFRGSILDRLGAIHVFSEVRRRRFDPALRRYTKTSPWFEIGRLMAIKAGLTKFTSAEKSTFSIDNLSQKLDKEVAQRLQESSNRGVTAVYGYEDSSSFTFSRARQLGLTCLYDLPIGYWRTARKLLEREKERWPEWVPTLKGFRDSDAKLERKDEELRLADCIFVASNFTRSTLADFPGTVGSVHVIPYGFPTVGIERRYSKPKAQHPLKLLFVGGLSQRKGIADIFAVVENLKQHVQLTIVGRRETNNCPPLDAALAKHRWIASLSHPEILQLMREHDVLVFPSLFEGFGLVITEAMSQGTPVITTDRTAGPDFINNGENGWLVEAGSTEALQVAIEELLYRPQDIAEAGRSALETARSRPWEVYGRELANAVKEVISA